MRKLAAIMFTDIEGFTKLMQFNEAQAMRVLERYKQTYLQQVKQFKGQHIKFLGDGTLTIFSSAIEAVNCAIALQQLLQAEPIIPVRIGIHQGDVIIENKDVLGDAVNLASRIQPCGIGGSILLSQKVCDELQNHDEISTIALGGFHLKNISYRVNLHAVKAEGIKVPDAHSVGPDKKPPLPKPTRKSRKNKTRRLLKFLLLLLLIGLLPVWYITKSRANKTNELLKTIAVIPFETIGSGGQNTGFAEGLTEEMITLLYSNLELTIKRIPGNAISNNKGNLEKLLREFKAGCVLVGKVQYDENHLSVFVDLIQISTSDVIWSGKYSDKFEDLMSVQENVAKEIANALKIKFSRNDIKNFILDRTSDPEAYKFYLEGRAALRKRTPQSMREAIMWFNKAIAEDSNFVLAYSGLGDAYTLLIDNGYLPYDSGVNLARNAVNHAFNLDSSSAEIRASRAIFFSSLEGRYTDAVSQLKLALDISPKYADANHWYALELAAGGQFDAALSHIDKALILEPLSERMWANKGLILKFARRYEEAIKVLDSALSIFSDNRQQFYKYKTECHFWLGQKDSVLTYASFSDDKLGDYIFWKAVLSKDKPKLQQILDGQLKNKHITYTAPALLYVFMEEKEKALSFIKNAYDNKEFSSLVYLNVEPGWDPLRKEPAFLDIVHKMGLSSP